MTIVEAIKIVLESNTGGLTSREIYQKIIDAELYVFPAKKPDAVVNSTGLSIKLCKCMVA